MKPDYIRPEIKNIKSDGHLKLKSELRRTNTNINLQINKDFLKL